MPPKRLPSLRPTADLISFPLLKFSDATDHESEKTFSWKHTTLDLTAVFDTFQAGATSQVNRSSKVLKVVQGTKVLELLNVEQLSQDTIALTTETRRHSTQLHKDKLPLTGLIRCPLLALRYILPGGMVRRIQLKFLRDEDFRVAVSYLERLGCVLSQTPVSEKTARPERSGPSCSTSSLAALPENPSSDSPSSVQIFPPKKPFCDGIPTVYDQAQNLRPTSARIQRPDSMTGGVHSVDRPMSGPSLSSSRPYIPPFSLPQHTDANFNLSSIPPASGQAVTHQPSLYPIPEHLPTSHHPISNAGGGDRLGDINWSSSTSRDRPATSSPYFAQPPATPPSTVSSSNISSERPSTAPLFSDENSILQLIPPRRELPFPRAAVGKKRNFDVATSSSRPFSAVELPPLPTPRFVTKADIPASYGHRTTAGINQEKHNQRSVSEEPSAETELLDAGAHLTTRLTEHRVPLSKTSTNIHASNSMDRELPLDSIKRISNLLSNSTSSDNAENLAQYASQSSDERMAVLDELFVSFIEDDNFITLCEDVSNCWRRIALGL